jgi:hypothetical protein
VVALSGNDDSHGHVPGHLGWSSHGA